MHVYFIEAICKPSMVKIGISSDVGRRIKQLQTSMPFELRLIGCKQFSSRIEALKNEAKLHKKLKNKQRQGEWFRLTPKTRSFIVQLVGDSTAIPPPMSTESIAETQSPNYGPPSSAMSLAIRRAIEKFRNLEPSKGRKKQPITTTADLLGGTSNE